MGPVVLGGVIFYPGEQSAQVMTGWRDLLPGVPDELTTQIALATAPAATFISLEWQGKKVVSVVACWAGDPTEGEEVVRPLRSLGTPIADLLGPIRYVDLQQLFDPAWPAGAANYFTSAFFDRMPDEAINTVVDYQRRAATCRCVPSCTFITSAERFREFRPALPPSPTARRTLCSSASRVHLAEPNFQNISNGHALREMPWQSTEKGACT